MPLAQLVPRVLVLVVATAMATPLVAEEMKDYYQRQREAAIDRTRAEANAPNRPSSSPTYGSPSGPVESAEDRQAREAEEKARGEARVKQAMADAAYERKVAADNREYYRQQEAQRVAQAEQKERDARLARDQARRWATNLEGARSVLATAKPGSSQAKSAVDQLRSDTKEGSPDATGDYGWLLVQGVHVTRDAAEGRRLLRESLDKGGDATAMSRYGKCLADGIGGPVDELAARGWHRAAIACQAPNQAEARRELAQMEETGRGAKADPAAALRWYREAAEMGDAKARLRMAVMLRDGVGMPADRAKAMSELGKLALGEDREVAEMAGREMRVEAGK